MQPSVEVARQLDSIAYSQLSWFFKLIRSGPACLELCSCLEPRELVRLASLCLFTRHRITSETRFMNAVNRWKLNPVLGWAQFHALMRLHAPLTRALEASWPDGLNPETRAWLVTVTQLDWAKCYVALNAAEVLTQWTVWHPTEDWGSCWLIGQVDELGRPHGLVRILKEGGLFFHEGNFLHGKHHGYGRLIVYDNNYSYVGEWKEGKAHGQGTRVDDRGTYTGAWENSEFHGHGTWTSAQGNVHVGDWEGSILDGVWY
jgi:hypothetical protein